jgi:uncharacterized protein YyaL (SSP411 family)
MNLRLLYPSIFKNVAADYFGLTGRLVQHEESLDQTMAWIRDSFKATNDGGSSAYYHLFNGWQSSYPETTGYIIPTLLEYAEYKNDSYWNELAITAGDWLLEIQFENGAWQGGQIGNLNEPRVFNTAMILDGLCALFEFTGDQKYLNAAKRAYDWLIEVLSTKGLWEKFNVSNGGSFDLLSVACMYRVGQYYGEPDILLQKIVDAHLNFQDDNGWWSNCNFKASFENTALTHHLGYTLDGLLIIDEIRDNHENLRIVKKTALKLMSLFEVNLRLPAFVTPDFLPFYDLNKQKKTFSSCLTGNSQIAIVFLKLSSILNDLRFANTAYKLIDFNVSVSNRKYSVTGMDHGLAGSYPIYGNYQKFQYVNWAAKYHAESILIAIDKSKKRKRAE